MTFDLRVLVIGLAAFATAAAAGSALAPMAWRRALRDPAEARATALWRLQIMPGAAAIGAFALTLVANMFFEPRGADESAGLVLTALGAAALATIVASVVRLWRLQRSTREVKRAWMASAEPLALNGIDIPAYAIESTFPIVAVLGIRRPLLVVARRVLDACSPEELGAILAHESAHISRRDNLRRAALATMPNLLAWLPFSRRLMAAWHAAVEEVADDAAGQGSANGRLYLAEALISVARLAPNGPLGSSLPASALYRGENIERRVHRLLQPPAAVVVAARPVWQRLAMPAALLAAGTLALQPVHDLIEAAVTFLP